MTWEEENVLGVRQKLDYAFSWSKTFLKMIIRTLACPTPVGRCSLLVEIST